jgi:type VI secretion system secreted protein Hcp
MKARLTMLTLLLVAMLFATTSAHAAYNIFLQASGIQGESTSSTHPNWSEVLSMTYRVTNPIDLSAPPSSGKPTFSSVSVAKNLDKASPIFIQNCNSGTHIGTVVIEFEKVVNTAPVVFYRITLEDVVVSSIQHSGTATTGTASTLSESVTFDFSRIRWTYYPIDAKGGVGSKIETGWDVINNKPY